MITYVFENMTVMVTGHGVLSRYDFNLKTIFFFFFELIEKHSRIERLIGGFRVVV